MAHSQYDGSGRRRRSGRRKCGGRHRVHGAAYRRSRGCGLALDVWALPRATTDTCHTPPSPEHDRFLARQSRHHCQARRAPFARRRLHQSAPVRQPRLTARQTPPRVLEKTSQRAELGVGCEPPGVNPLWAVHVPPPPPPACKRAAHVHCTSTCGALLRVLCYVCEQNTRPTLVRSHPVWAHVRRCPHMGRDMHLMCDAILLYFITIHISYLHVPCTVGIRPYDLRVTVSVRNRIDP